MFWLKAILITVALYIVYKGLKNLLPKPLISEKIRKDQGKRSLSVCCVCQVHVEEGRGKVIDGKFICDQCR